MEVIKEFQGEYRFLSNFYFLSDGLTTEHKYQAAKTTNERDREFILSSSRPGVAKARGRTVELRSDWNDVRVGVMLSLLREKFTSPYLRERLLSTGTSHLEEGNQWGDRYWGVYQGTGENMLGKLLMQVREEIRKNAIPGKTTGEVEVDR